MKYLSSIPLLLLLVGCSTASRQAEAKALFDAPPHVEMTDAEVEIALVVGQGGRRYVPLDIRDRSRLFLLDTGAPTIVSVAVARDEGIATIPLARGTLYGGGGANSGSAGIIEKLSIRGVVISRLPAFFTDLTDWNARELAAQQHQIDGILGADLLEFLGASIDYTTNTLKLRKPNQQPEPTSDRGSPKSSTK